MILGSICSASKTIEQAGSMMSSRKAICTGSRTSGQPATNTGISAIPKIGTWTAMMYAIALRRLSKMPRPWRTPPAIDAKSSSVITSGGGLARDVGAACAHRDADVGGTQRRGVVDAVAGHADDLAVGLAAHG